MAEDIAPNRLTRAKLAALDLMHLARGDRLGLVAFAGGAFLQCPLTIDDSAFRQSVDALDVNIIPQGGTAIAEAIDTAMTAFKEGDNYKVLVLMTDGEDHDSGALKAAEAAAKDGLHIYTIGIGTKEGELLRVRDAQGKTDYIRDDQGNVVKSHLDEGLLQELAAATEGGFYLPLRGTKTIETLYDQGLARLPKSQHDARQIRQYHERYHWPLVLAIILLVTEMLFPERRRETASRAVPAPAKTAAAATLLLLLLATASALASPSGALREYEAGKYPEALKEYERLLEKQKDDPRLHFNAGAAAYRNKQFDEATKQFDQAVATPDLKLQQQAYFNRGNSLFRLGESADDPKKKTEQWEQSLKDFEIASKLSQKDPDAKFNYDFVKRKLEELKQQQQQQQKGDKNKDDKQNQDQQQQQQQQQNQQNQKDDQSKKDQQQKKDDQQKQSSKQNDSSQQNQQGDKQKQDQQQKGDHSKDQKEKQKQEQQKQGEKQDQQQASQPQDQKDNPDDQQQQEAQAAALGQMTPQQAKQLLDAQKGEEQLLPVKPNGKPADTSRPVKDW